MTTMMPEYGIMNFCYRGIHFVISRNMSFQKVTGSYTISTVTWRTGLPSSSRQKSLTAGRKGISRGGDFTRGVKRSFLPGWFLSRIWRGRKWQPRSHFMMSAAGILPVPDGCTGWQCAGNIRGLGSQNP